jgi:hypothetical protein
LNDEDQQ